MKISTERSINYYVLGLGLYFSFIGIMITYPATNLISSFTQILSTTTLMGLILFTLASLASFMGTSKENELEIEKIKESLASLEEKLNTK